MKRWSLLLLLLLLCGCGTKPPSAAVSTAQEEVTAAEQAAEETEPLGYVALTFDDGPTPAHTARLLDGLKERNVRATFFLAGYRLEGNEALVRRMRAEGHQIGNHSYDHVQLITLTAAQALEDLTRCDLALCTLLGEGDYWVRPPYGSIDRQTLEGLDVPVIGWSVDPLDWSEKDARKVADHIIQNAKDGDIILLHDCYAGTVEAALQAIDALLERGLQPVTVQQLLARNGGEAEGGCIYYRKN